MTRRTTHRIALVIGAFALLSVALPEPAAQGPGAAPARHIEKFDPDAGWRAP
jgi:hypothetical protein